MRKDRDKEKESKRKQDRETVTNTDQTRQRHRDSLSLLLSLQLWSGFIFQLWSGFIFPELEHLQKNVFTASFPKRNVRNLAVFLRSQEENTFCSNLSSRLGKDQLSMHFTRLLDDLKSSKNYCLRKLFSVSRKYRSIFGLKNQSCDRRTVTVGSENRLMPCA